MNINIAADAKPQANLLLTAALVSLGILVVSWFSTYAGYVLYPLQLFATFVHEGSHVLAAVLTGSSVISMSVSPDTSGVVWSRASSWLAQLFISSAGYLGTTAFGTLLLFWIRFGRSSRAALAGAGGLVAIMTLLFGLLFPVWNVFSAQVSFGSIAFTVFSGLLLSGGLIAIAKYASRKWADFALAFLAVQCLLNAFFSLKDLFFISTFTDMHSDAANMAEATGVPSVLWVFLWIGISVLMISIGLRIFAAAQKKGLKIDSVFSD